MAHFQILMHIPVLQQKENIFWQLARFIYVRMKINLKRNIFDDFTMHFFNVTELDIMKYEFNLHVFKRFVSLM